MARACIAALLALLVPGAGHAFAGDLRTAMSVMLLAPALGAVVCLATAAGLIPVSAFAPLALGLPGLILVLSAIGAMRAAYRGADIWGWSATISFAFGSAMLTAGAMATVHSEVLSLRRISSSSMEPLLHVGDYALVRKGPFVPPVQRSQILEFRFPRDRRFAYVQRVVAISGERVSMVGDAPTVDGTSFAWTDRGTQEWRDADCGLRPAVSATESALGTASYTVLSSDRASGARSGPGSSMDPMELRDGELFMLSDNRANADDSRRWGALPTADVAGQVFGVALSWDPCGGRLRTERMGRLR